MVPRPSVEFKILKAFQMEKLPLKVLADFPWSFQGWTNIGQPSSTRNIGYFSVIHVSLGVVGTAYLRSASATVFVFALSLLQ